MTEAREGIDPRFDARFQRGYDGHAADAAVPARSTGDEPGPSDPPLAGERRPAAARELPLVHVPGELPPDSAREDDLDLFAGLELDAEPEAVLDGDRADGSDGDDDGDDDGTVDAVPVPGAAPPQGATARTWAWLGAGWAFGAVVAVSGLWIVWTAAASFTQSYAVPTEDPAVVQMIQTLSWTLAPSLLMAGGVGIVLVTAVAASLTDLPAPRGRAFARPAAWWGLLVLAGVGLLAVPAAVSMISDGMTAGMDYMGSSGPGSTPEEMSRMDAMARGQIAQSTIGALALTVTAAIVSIASLEARRSVRRSASGAASAD